MYKRWVPTTFGRRYNGLLIWTLGYRDMQDCVTILIRASDIRIMMN